MKFGDILELTASPLGLDGTLIMVIGPEDRHTMSWVLVLNNVDPGIPRGIVGIAELEGRAWTFVEAR